MLILLSLILTTALVYGGGGMIKKKTRLCFALAGAVSFAAIALTWSGLTGALPPVVRRYIVPLFTKGSMAMALFYFVMFANAVPNGSPFMKRIMPIRGELSIIACILAFGHAAALGRAQLRHALNGGSTPLELAALAVSLVLMAIRLPLFVTSFKAVRRRMKPRSWKRLQRTAYVFYALIFVHILCYNMLPARQGSLDARVSVAVYGALFFSYVVMRLGKALMKASPDKAWIQPALSAVGGMAFTALIALMWPLAAPVSEETLTARAEPAAPQVAAAAPAGLRDGEYTGRSVGYNGALKVVLTVTNGEIVSVRLKSCVDDEEYVDMAADRIFTAIVAAQSASVDAVSGATTTSQALIDAAADAISQAQAPEEDV